MVFSGRRVYIVFERLLRFIDKYVTILDTRLIACIGREALRKFCGYEEVNSVYHDDITSINSTSYMD
ncbi:hypothetical protein ACFL96_06420 [Thermoproteota archaeon]